MDTSKRVDAAQELLVKRCLRRQPGAWRELYAEYSPLVITFLRHLGVPTTELDDTRQEVFLQMYRSLESFRGEAALKSWTYRLCVTQAQRFRRKARVRLRVAEQLAVEVEIKKPLAALEFTEEIASRAIESALSDLSERDRRVLVLHSFRGFSGRDIAAATALSLPNVWRIVHFARRRFEARLQHAGLAGFGAASR